MRRVNARSTGPCIWCGFRIGCVTKRLMPEDLQASPFQNDLTAGAAFRLSLLMTMGDEPMDFTTFANSRNVSIALGVE